jgi:hypothetical protein
MRQGTRLAALDTLRQFPTFRARHRRACTRACTRNAWPRLPMMSGTLLSSGDVRDYAGRRSGHWGSACQNGRWLDRNGVRAELYAVCVFKGRVPIASGLSRLSEAEPDELYRHGAHGQLGGDSGRLYRQSARGTNTSRYIHLPSATTRAASSSHRNPNPISPNRYPVKCWLTPHPASR